MPSIAPPLRLTDGVVTLRPFRDSDVPALVAACQDPEIPRWTGVPSPYDAETAHLWLASHETQRVAGWGVPFAIADPATDTLLGSMGLENVRWSSSAGEAGYWVARPARGRGVASRALRLLARWALGELGLCRLEVPIHVDNIASQRVALRVGCAREGVLRSSRVLQGRRCDVALYSLLPSDLTGEAL